MTLRTERARRSAERSRRLRPDRPVLTEREWELLNGWAEGRPTKVIADEAKSHRQTYYTACLTLYAKLNSPRYPAAAMLRAIHYGLIKPEEWIDEIH